jgi:hypothetical protein
LMLRMAKELGVSVDLRIDGVTVERD